MSQWRHHPHVLDSSFFDDDDDDDDELMLVVWHMWVFQCVACVQRA
jgi:hypothetical protein